MLVASSKGRKAQEPSRATSQLLAEISSASLRSFVEALAFPRHFIAEHAANRRARDMLLRLSSGFGYEPFLQGEHDNIVMTSPGPADSPRLLLGAHYDSVPRTPGADDNASALSVCLECARLIQRHRIPSTMMSSSTAKKTAFSAARNSLRSCRSNPHIVFAKRIFLRWSVTAIDAPNPSECRPVFPLCPFPTLAIS